MKFRWVAAVAALAAMASVGWWFTHREPQAAPTPLMQVSLPEWSELLGGESGITKASIGKLNSVNVGLDGQSLQQARNVATAAALSALTGVPYGLESYDAPEQGTTRGKYTRCSNVKLLGESVLATEYDGEKWARALVLYSGKCSGSTYTRSSPGVEYVYEVLTSAGWSPVRSWNTPGAGSTRSSSDLDPGSLISMGPCGVVDGEEYLDRPRVAVAFQRLCAAAKREGVVLVISSAWRSREQQQKLFEEAVDAYGSTTEAAKHVSPANSEVCASRHCSGLAVGVETDRPAVAWLAAAGSCLGPDGSSTEPVKGQCPPSTRTATNSQLYGFATPPQALPGYLEYVLPAGLSADGKADADCAPYGEQVPAVIASVFRCRLGEAGVNPAETEQAVAQALMVARCSSGLNPQATVFGGKYTDQVKPGTNRTFSLGGLFALAPTTAVWQSGSLADPVAAANYAAKLWLVDHSFSRFFCATGSDKDLAASPAISTFGGPAAAAWATQW